MSEEINETEGTVEQKEPSLPFHPFHPDQVAYLTNNQRYSIFSFGDKRIKFKTSPYLLHYDSIKKWDNGYIECMASYSTRPEPIEEYIDLQYIAGRLRLPENVFQQIKEVRIG